MDEPGASVESLRLSTVEKNIAPNSHNCLSNLSNHNADDLWYDDDDDSFLHSNSNGALDMASSDLEREWHRRHDQFHTIGYRDGLMAGKEASAQEGFNDGFKQSVLVGCKWGLVRGVTSALSCLPAEMKATLAGTLETQEKLQNLYGNVHAISTKDALKIYNDEILGSELEKNCEDSNENSHVLATTSVIPSSSQLGRYIKELELLLESSAIRLHVKEWHLA